ncbi:hypothetical protein ES288_A04G099300v1 [Gossypium darwinii]|uniref:Uncharacterized protein n=1 Tax=Gossypium darwinii TaxID=34276 RepID=A0A5D2GW73_GOSDA|nr:hypothetical protein ES288_A04G099300v1 [Gossypium darwinii]
MLPSPLWLQTVPRDPSEEQTPTRSMPNDSPFQFTFGRGAANVARPFMGNHS